MSKVGNELKAAHDLLEKAGNCSFSLHDVQTGEFCAWGALNQVTVGNAFSTHLSDVSLHFEVLNKLIPENFDNFDFSYWEKSNAQRRVVAYNNRNPGQPVIDLFAKAAADEGYDA